MIHGGALSAFYFLITIALCQSFIEELRYGRVVNPYERLPLRAQNDHPDLSNINPWPTLAEYIIYPQVTSMK